MKLEILKHWVYLLLFVGAGLIIFKAMPNKAQFDVHYEVGKPWQHSLLTASFDFPIYKSENELKVERDSIMHFYVPYYKIDESIANQQINAFRRAHSFEDAQLIQYVEKTLRSIYRFGIIDTKTYDGLLQKNVASIALIDSLKVARTVPFSSIFTNRTAYNYLCSNGPRSENAMRMLNLNQYLTENLTLDKAKSEKIMTELYAKISLTSGMVQAGQRIIDRGEIVDYQTFKILNSYKRAIEREPTPERSNGWVIVGELLLIYGFLFLFALYLYLFRMKFFSVKNVGFMLMMIVLMVVAASVVVRFSSITIYVVPFALLPIIIRIFFDSRTALFAHLIAMLLVVMMAPEPFLFLILQVTAGMVAVSSLKQMNRRSQLVQVSLFILLNYILAYVGFTLLSDGSLGELDWEVFLGFIINAVLLLFAYLLIFIFEKLFGFLSDVTLVELSNINNKLLMEFSEKAPGSFQHVLQVSNLAAEAARCINANPLLTRTGALYHDIGKLINPMLFTENQVGGINPLSSMPYEEAAQIIISHVPEGVKIAEKAGLPKQIINFIRTHHAKSVTKYFYNSYRNAYPDREIDISKFTYPGPLPSTKEEAIVMMADAVEATSRSLKSYSEESISKIVETIINGQIAEQSLSNAPITFRDVERVKAVFKEKLQNIYHNRISYPELKTEPQKKEGEELPIISIEPLQETQPSKPPINY